MKRISSDNLLNIISHLPNALLLLTPDFRIVFASNSYLKATLADRDAIIGKNVFEVFPDNPEDDSASGVSDLKASFNKVLETKKPQQMPVQKYDVPRPDGTFEEKYWNVTNTPVLDETGKLKHIIHSVVDVTEQVKTEATLELAVEASQLGTWEMDLTTGRVIHRNLRHDQIYGYKSLQPAWDHDIARKKILPEDLKIYDAAFSEAKETGQLHFEVRTKWEDGSIHWMEVQGTIYFAPNGKPSRAAGVNMDITERRRAEETLRKAKEEAEAASRAKEDFLSTMSHEIRTPLNAVIGLSNLLLEKDPLEEQKPNLESLNFAANNLLQLINDILDFSKLEAGKMTVSEKKFDLSELMRNLKNSHELQAAEKGLELELFIHDAVPKRICADQIKLSQILHNLVGNALKFTRKGGVSIAVDLVRKENENLWLQFSIEDSGKGIPDDKLEYIFEKFAQQRNTSESDSGGTGLGLSITKSLLEIMGGTIQVESNHGKGSVFTFNLPVKKASFCAPGTKLPKVKKEQTANTQNKQILLAEDVEINRDILIQYLTRWWNIIPDEAKNGEEAIKMARQKKYDLILMDLRMPKIDGYEASLHIRRLNGYQRTPILAFTAENKNKIRHSKLFNGTLSKPFDPSELKQEIQHFLHFSEKDFKKNGVTASAETAEKIQPREPTFNISRFKEFAEGNRELLQKLLAGSIKAVEEYRNDFLAVKNEEALSDLIHKNTTNVHYISASQLTEKMERFKDILANPAAREQELEKKKREILEEFDSILEGLKVVL